MSDTSVSRFIDSAANALDGNGDKLRQTLAQLSGAARIFAEGSGNIVDIIKNLQIFVTALRDSKQQIVMFQNRLASLTSVVNDSRSDLDAALSDLSVAIGEVQRFVAGSRNQTSEQIRGLASVTQNLVDNRMALENVLHISPNAIANFENIYYPPARCRDRSVLARQLREPGVLRLRPDRRHREHHRARDGETLRAIPRSRIAAAQLQLPAVPDQPVPAPGDRSGQDHLHRSEAGTRRRRARRCARTAADGVGLHRHGRCRAASGPGLGTATWTAGTVRPGRSARHPVAGVVPRRADTRAAHHHPGNVAAAAVDGMLLPQTAAPAAPPPPPGPPLPAEGGAPS